MNSFIKGMKNFLTDINRVIDIILLLIIYILGVGLTSIIAKIAGKHFLDLKINKNKDTYWGDLTLNKNQEDYYQQF